MNSPTPRTPIRLLLVPLLVVALLLSACSSSDDSDQGAPSASTPTADTADEATPSPEPEPATEAAVEATVPLHQLLTPGPDTHVGATWFSPAEPGAEDVVFERWGDVTDASSVGRAMFDWIDVEPQAGDYRLDEVDEALAAIVEAGQQPMLSIVARDTSGTDWPEWLGGFDPEQAAAAYLAMAEQFVPMMERHDVWLFAIANEPPLADDDEMDRGDFATFVELVVDGMQELAPDLATTFTFAGGDPLIDDPDIDRLVEAVDVFSVNHYCLMADLRVIDMDDAIANIDVMVERAGDLPVVFQEFGCPAGELMGSSEEFQLEWFEIAFAHIAEVDQVRAAFVFEFLDWSPSTLDLAYGADMDILAAAVGQGFADRLGDWLLTSGLVRNDGSTRPAFDLYLEMAPTLAAG